MTNPTLRRHDDENLREYMIRICSNKDRYELSWEDVKDLFNHETGDKWGESKYRKWWAAFSEGIEYAKVQNIESDEVLDELEIKKIELLEERKKLQAIRSEYNKIAREKGRKELLFEDVKEAFVKIDVPSPTLKVLQQDAEKAHVLSFGDIHFGKKFASISNEYSEEIAMERMNDLLSQVVAFIKKENITYLHIINGADSVEGMTLRTSQLQALQSGFVDQVIKFSKFYAKWINKLSEFVQIELHHVTSSNHTEIRPHNSGRGEYPKEDLERIIGMYIQDVLENNSRVKVNLYENGFVDFKLLDYNIGGLHGHQLKNNKNAVRDLSMLHRKFYDYLYVAHFHHGNALTVGEASTNNVQVFQMPSIMGSDEYSDSLMTGAKAGAVLHTYTKGKGKTSQEDFILN